MVATAFVANKAETTEHSLCWTLRIANNNKLCSKYRNKNYVILDMMVLNDEIFWRFIHEFIHFLFRLFCTCCNREKAMESTEHSHCSNVITPPTPQTEEEEDVLWPQNWCRRKIQMECNLFMKIGKFDVFRKICDIIRCNNCIHNGQIDGGFSCESLLGYEAIGLTVMNTKWIDNDYPTRSVLFIGVRFMRHSTNACIIHTTNLCIISIKSIVTKQSVINHKYAHHWCVSSNVYE